LPQSDALAPNTSLALVVRQWYDVAVTLVQPPQVPFLAALDVHYSATAQAACVVASDWRDAEPLAEYTAIRLPGRL
jgi:deoxyinosine 3'endonuclease (endonuclease V)